MTADEQQNLLRTRALLATREIEQHTLVGVDASGSLCACGVKGDHLEHLGAVALFLLDDLLLHRCWCGRLEVLEGLCRGHASAVVKARVREDRRWAEGQVRRENLDSYRWPAERAPKFEPSDALVAFAVGVLYNNERNEK